MRRKKNRKQQTRPIQENIKKIWWKEAYQGRWERKRLNAKFCILKLVYTIGDTRNEEGRGGNLN